MNLKQILANSRSVSCLSHAFGMLCMAGKECICVSAKHVWNEDVDTDTKCIKHNTIASASCCAETRLHSRMDD